MDGNSLDLTEAEDIKKRWQECTEELQKKGLNGPDNHDGVTHLELDILECEVKWVSESITTNKASGRDGIPAELFKNPIWCCSSAAFCLCSFTKFQICMEDLKMTKTKNHVPFS